MTNWTVEQLRLTAFPVTNIITRSVDWWRELFEEEPEAINTKPKIGFSEIIGDYGPGRVIHTIDPVRIHWRLIPRQKDDDIGILISFGDLEEVLPLFIDLVERWFKLDSCPSLRRIAFGSILRKPVGSHEEGYSEINNYLPDVKVDPVSSDFRYQINRPRKISAPFGDIEINRLSKWGVLVVRVEPKMENGSAFEINESIKSYYINLELDINTSIDFRGNIDCEYLSDIFGKLVNFGFEISDKGDIP